jgi:L-lactate dehydrogenase complex protein LldG
MVTAPERENLIQQFSERATALGAKVERFPDFDSCRKFIGKFLQDRRPRGIAASESLRKKIRTTDLVIGMDSDHLQNCAQAELGVILADYGLAETGTLAQFSVDDAEKLPGILPLVCLAILPTGRIVPAAESIAELISQHLAQTSGFGPQVAFISGPSRTADIECELQIGVHGPAELFILLLDRGLE